MVADIGQCCDVVAVFGIWSKYNVGTMFKQHCLDVKTMLLGHLKVSKFEYCHNVVTDVETTLAPTLKAAKRDVNMYPDVWLVTVTVLWNMF